MESKKDLEKQVMMAAADNGISSVLFRNAIGRKLGLNVTDSECLSLLAIKGTSTPTELARYTGLTTGSTTTMLDRLERANFIKRKPNPNDRRGVLVEISKQWQEKAGPLVAGVQKTHGELLSTYSTAELEIIADFLTRFTENVKVQTKHIES
ncbi:MAG TPA: MarR family transcriptional regulator [Candidatus Saccharimonadales bacterium]|nr:MarR family transcriptional regulator [Candidatus Saccharimonadales bacterium]